MTLDEAIDRLDKEVEWALPKDDLKSLKAVRLGREALKREQENRQFYRPELKRLLPGETKEGK